MTSRNNAAAIGTGATGPTGGNSYNEGELIVLVAQASKAPDIRSAEMGAAEMLRNLTERFDLTPRLPPE